MDCGTAYMHSDQDVTDENYVHPSPDIIYADSDVHVSQAPFSMAGYATQGEYGDVAGGRLGAGQAV